MAITPINPSNAHIFDVLAQDYESEFSALTHKEPDINGRFALEISWQKPYEGFYQFTKEKPIGFTIKGIRAGRFDMGEFYILPCYRKKEFGKKFAFEIFDRFPGNWQVRQLQKASGATAFWRRVIDEYTNGNYSEDFIEDSHW